MLCILMRLLLCLFKLLCPGCDVRGYLGVPIDPVTLNHIQMSTFHPRPLLPIYFLPLAADDSASILHNRP